jgi:hypothetical protein
MENPHGLLPPHAMAGLSLYRSISTLYLQMILIPIVMGLSLVVRTLESEPLSAVAISYLSASLLVGERTLRLARHW